MRDCPRALFGVAQMWRSQRWPKVDGMTISSPRRVLIVGGGVAALETLLALRALAGDTVSVTMVAPNERFCLRTALCREPSAEEPSAEDPPASCDLRACAEQLGADFRRDTLHAVAGHQHRVRLASFATLDYDFLVLGLGARAHSAVPGALVFRDQRDAGHVWRILHELEREEIRRVVFAVPSGCAWPLPVFELALMTARHAERHAVPADTTVVSPSPEPLDLLGHEAAREVRHVLATHGVRFEGSSVPAAVRRDHALTLHFGGAIAADRVVTVPQLRGQRITGLHGAWWGFVPVDRLGRVEGMDDVYAAGDMIAFPIKHGGLAAQQADLIAQAIAHRAGARVPEPNPQVRVLHTQLRGAEHPIALRALLDDHGNPATGPGPERTPRGASQAGFQSAPEGLSPHLAGNALGRFTTPFLQKVVSYSAERCLVQ